MKLHRKSPFAFDSDSEKFSVAFHEDLAEQLAEQRNQVISPNNSLRMNHGTKWQFKQVDSEEFEDGEMELHSVETSYKYQEIVDYDLKCIAKHQNEIVGLLMKEFMQGIYKTLEESTEKSGNVVSGQGGPFTAELYLELLEKIEFGVNADGEVSLPQFHTAPEAAGKILNELNSQGSEFRQKVEELMEKKKGAALEKEKIRKSKFPSKG